jgi:hypothetical protein
MSLIWPLYSYYVTSVLVVPGQRRVLRSVGRLETAVFPTDSLQGVTGGTDNTSGGCSLGQTMPI